MKADFTGSVKPGSELAPPLTDDIACLGLIGSVLTSRIQVYMAMENINCFDEVMSKGWFDVQFLCTTREGLGFGGCGKSILSHVYAEGRISGTSFNPRYVITWSDYTDALFRHSSKLYFPELRRLADYIPENTGAHDHHLYECWNQHKPGVVIPQMGSPFPLALGLPLG